MNDIKCGMNINSPHFTGKVDSSVNKYVTLMKKESKKIYKENCNRTGMKMNPAAFRLIDERCDTAFEKLTKKAEILHKDTVIKTMKNPIKSDNNLFFVAENKGLVQEWEQKGAIDILSIDKNNLREVRSLDKGSYDRYISRFESFVDNLNPETLDKKMVRTSISNLWNLNVAKVIRGNYAETYTKSTQKVAKEIGYPNTTFPESLAEHFTAIREKFTPKKEKSDFSVREFLKSIFTKKEDKAPENKVFVI